MEDKRLTIINTILSCLIVVLAIVYSRNAAIFDDIILFSSRHLPTACIFVLSLFVFKAFIPFFPSFALYTLTGRILPYRIAAFFVNLAGAALVNTITYMKGAVKKRAVSDEKRPEKSRKKQVIAPLYRYKLVEKADMLFRRFKNAISGGDFKTMVIFGLSPIAPFKSFGAACGRSGTDFRIYIAGTLIGVIPKITAATFLGKSLSDPDSPVFFLSLTITVAVTVASALIVLRTSPKKK